jgi:hypothetical protein
MLPLDELKKALEHDSAQRKAPEVGLLEVRRSVRAAVLLLDEADSDLVAAASGLGAAGIEAKVLKALDDARARLAEAERRLSQPAGA